ncbi:cation:proton antiporter [Sphaerisporangium sp. TRM90804]|uniref:cation:proton antiporter domain-containing protein n=1 Tax=Sphaerisporangium sp. TRM90804 TaxID=3031113 RepID=UPI0024489713|nr:cation:proton antiporter [Sphaerisporangium sp. TRM90804]MDH2427307.1 cation:proton antiporter [Sphaerisporangium sp. TRM90804]
MHEHHVEWQITTTVAGIGLILLVATAAVLIARLLRQPAVIGEIGAGIVMGPSVLGLFPGDLTNLLFPPELRPHLSVVAQVGVLLFLFIVGWEFAPAAMREHRRSAGLIWLSSMATPMALGAALAWVLYPAYGTVDGRQVEPANFVLYLSVAMSVTAFPVLARIIAEHRLQDSRVGTLALALAAADDVLAWSVLAVVVALVAATGTGGFVMVIVWSVVYVVVMLTLVRPLLASAFRRVGPAAHPWLAMLTTAGVLLSAYTTSVIGIHAIFGAFMFGLVMPRSPSPALRSAVQGPLERVGALLMPVFFVVTGLSVDLTTLTGVTLLVTLGIIVVACLGKLGGVAVPARLSGMSTNGSLVLGLLMNTRGLTELVILNVGLGLGLLNTQLFSAMVVMAVVTTAMASPLLSLTLRRAPSLRDGAGPPLDAVASVSVLPTR